MKLPFLALACTLAVTVYGQDTPHLHNDNRVTEELGPQLRIVGGQQASPGDYPFYVEWNGCGAVLIHSDIVLSAAHCHEAITSNTMFVGGYKTESTEEGAEIRRIETRVPHPDYDDNTFENDFVILKLTEASTKTPIEVNYDRNIPSEGDLLTVVGLGDLTGEGTDFPTYLQEVDVEYVPFELCNTFYSGEIVEEVMLCAGFPEGGKDSCQGDSGGPIFTADNVLVGIVSFGYRCALARSPGVYARTSGVKAWITENICSLSDDPPASCTGDSDGSDFPTPSPGHDDEVLIQLSMILDDYPEEVSVMISTLPDFGILHVFDNFTDIESFTTSFYLAPGNYAMLLSDNFGDGFCCDHGMGGYQVEAILDEGSLVLLNDTANFSFSILEEFTVPVPDSNATYAPSDNNSTDFGLSDTCDELGGNETCVILSFVLDNYPWETSADVTSLETLEIVWKVDNFEEPGLFTDTIVLEPGDYILRVMDSLGDGTCCNYGNGYFEVLAIRPDGNETLLLEEDGIFTLVKETPFTVPRWDY